MNVWFKAQRRVRSGSLAARGIAMALLCAMLAPLSIAEDGRRHGATRNAEDGALLAWNADSEVWETPEAFWLSWAAAHGGLRWGRRTDYPTYSEVAERDLMIIDLPQGACLMEFWHRRWRRAQDVRRWSPDFNAYGGCPFVFD